MISLEDTRIKEAKVGEDHFKVKDEENPQLGEIGRLKGIGAQQEIPHFPGFG